MRISDWSSDVCSSDLLKCVTQFIDENLAGEIAIPRLSNVAGLSPSHFLRLFKVATGQTPHQFIVRRRVEKAQHLLRGTSQPIARSEEHTSELQSLMRISYAVFCLKKNITHLTTVKTKAIQEIT